MSLEKDIQLAIENKVEEARQQVIQLAVEDFELRVRRIVADVSLQVLNYYTVERHANELVIRVKIEKGE